MYKIEIVDLESGEVLEIFSDPKREISIHWAIPTCAKAQVLRDLASGISKDPVDTYVEKTLIPSYAKNQRGQVNFENWLLTEKDLEYPCDLVLRAAGFSGIGPQDLPEDLTEE
jgi:hypothetical protein